MEFREYTDGLKPRYRFLSDKAVIVQAWKKAHEYIRRHNWYSDNLDLDLSCINLEDLYLEIQNDFAQGKCSGYRPSSMRLVLAPKACNGWKLDEGDFQPPEGFALRPLAHLKVKDQVVAMMFLMCLANIIERRQGIALSVKKLTRLTDVVSYGNRLITDATVSLEDDEDLAVFEQNRVSFLWGNSETYNRYYEDYQNFVARPKDVLRRVIEERIDCNCHYYIVSLDLKRFYDRIDREELFAKVKREVEATREYDEKFMDAFRHMLEWRWDDQDCASAKDAGVDDEQCGIPQGLAAGGFLANIYLLSFDDEMKRIVDNGCSMWSADVRFKIHDYCRYVDDMRLVVEVNRSVNVDERFKNEFVERIQRILSELCPGQEFSPQKVNWEEVGDAFACDFVSLRMAESKVRASGTMDERSACELIELNRALWSDSALLENDSGQNNSKLNSIRSTRSRTSVKADRIERFAVNNWRRAYRALDGMLPHKPNKDSETSGAMPLNMLNLLTDEFCEEILKRWATDPSKVRILRIALDLRPRQRYLEFVLDALSKMWSSGDSSRLCAAYVLAELYRAGSIETGFAYANEESEYREEWLRYRKYLHEQVARFSELDLPWFTANQLMLYELSYDKGASLSRTFVASACDKIYCECYNLISGIVTPEEANNLPASTFILASKIAADESIVERYSDALRSSALLRPEDARKCLAFLLCDISPVVPKFSYAVTDVSGAISLPKMQLEWKNLHDVVFSSANPFENEIAIVRLGLALWEFLKTRRVTRSSYFTLQNLKVYCSNWESLSKASTKDCDLVIDETIADCESDSYSFMFKPEVWERGLFAKMAQIGRLLRAAAMTGDEYSKMRRQFLTIPHEENGIDTRRFFGVRSIWLKRRYGLYFDRVCLGGVHVAFSPWFSELLSALLAWPGSYVANRYKKLTFRGLKDELQSRLMDLAQFDSIDPSCALIPVDVDISKFCKSGGANQGKVNIAVVQTLCPNSTSLSDPNKLWSKVSERKKARRHLSDMFEMLEKTFETHSALMKKKESINLIVFPELSIYPQDIAILERFADQRNCMIFCGLVYCQHPSISTKLINTGIWIIPQRRAGHERRTFIELPQGKANLAHIETDPRLVGYRPVQWIVRGVKYTKRATRRIWSMSASICYDATDIRLAAALRDHIDCYIVSAFNPDVGLFDTMAESWRYHMYGHTVLANTGVYGGSTIQAPYKESYERILAHSHGGNQAQILLATLDLGRFENQTIKARVSPKKPKNKAKPIPKVKTSPAGYSGRKR